MHCVFLSTDVQLRLSVKDETTTQSQMLAPRIAGPETTQATHDLMMKFPKYAPTPVGLQWATSVARAG